ncbi:nucleotidyltransferase domain-containing protein [Coraliomargarita sinensis]|uniref:nucleotidyltransferase domain-containing protein n=1 Tax=Coraliomargarita sinensis TaxID=2174842 RepID=UPI001304E66B|nr:nucleotidyltransferase domain-containing protein [Coraliomargarita sinensis]
MKELVDFFEEQDDVAIAFLFGSRARGSTDSGDWDLALFFGPQVSSRLERLARLERLRSSLAGRVGCSGELIDLADLERAPIGLCITVAEEGTILKGHGSLELFRFYQRAWSAQEEFHFRKAHGL